MFWNVNGFMDTIKSPEVSAWLINNCDICFFSETHMTKGDDSFKINDFKCINHPFSDALVKKPRGGMVCMIKYTFLQYVKKIDCDTPDNMVLSLHGGHTIFGSYIPPSDSLYYDETCFACIPNNFSGRDSSVIIGGGDLNCRVGNVTQKIPLLNTSYRPNVDTTMNSNGRFLRKICNSYNCYILNNLSIGALHLDGDFTFHKGGRRSQNDICLSNLHGLHSITNFSIHKIGWNFSDHFPVSVATNLNLYDAAIPLLASEDIHSCCTSEVSKRPHKVKTGQVDWEGYRVIAGQEIEMMYRKIELLKTKPNIDILNEVVDDLSDKMYKAAKTCEIKTPKIVTPEVTETPLMGVANERLNQYSNGLCSWDEWNDVRKTAVSDINSRHVGDLIQQWSDTLESKDSKRIWEKINWKGGQKEIEDEAPPLEDLAKQFQSKDAGVDEDLCSLQFGDNYVPILDDEISVEEIDMAATRRLKEGKSTSDGWTPKMITEISDILYPILFLIFNTILRCSMFPLKWWFSVVVALFKNKGSRSIAKFFRPVSLVVMLSKLFDFVMLRRFKEWFTPHDMNTAYQEGKSCSDHIFLMRCVREQFLKDKKKLFITAVDFDGAFDRVKRSTLLRKLIFAGAGSTFVMCLANLYSISGNIIYHNDTSITYLLYSGIKQGLPLSPFLFLFYIDDLFDYLDRVFNNTCSDIYDRLHVLIHADDANLFATSRDLMIRKIRTLLAYCKENSVLLQASKCFFTVINGADEDEQTLHVDDHDGMEYTEYLEILGSHISSSMNMDLDLHYKKRFKNVIKFYNYVRMNKLAPISVRLKVLKSCVVHTLLYNCEAFGPKLPDGLEETYYKMLRAALGVRSNSPKLILLVEAGFLPIKCLALSRQLNFFRRFQMSIKTDSTRDNIFKKLLTKTTSYLRHYVNLDGKYESSDLIFQEYQNDLCQKIRTLSNNKEEHYKYWIYLQLNPELKVSPFLNRIDLVGKAMTRFRVGSHRLRIETLRWSGVKREDRKCVTCGELGDEKHAIFTCSEIMRHDLDLPQSLSSIWDSPHVNQLFKRIMDAGYC